MSVLLFIVVFVLYIYELSPALAPWRDTGEMSVVASTLSIAHPTSYPLYTLIAHCFGLFKMGNYAYWLNVLSAVFGAAAISLLFAFFKKRYGALPALSASLLLAFNGSFWIVSSVSEMYSLWILSAVCVFIMATLVSENPQGHEWLFFCFLLGLLLGNRLDLLLWAPGLILIARGQTLKNRNALVIWGVATFLFIPALAVMTGSNVPFALLILGTGLWSIQGENYSQRLLHTALASLCGLSVYLYLPIRSGTSPFLDWNHPAVLSHFLDSILRTRYGGTLDLVSTSYAKGELFPINLKYWGEHLWTTFGPLGLLSVIIGFRTHYIQDRSRWLGQWTLWFCCGPLFIFLANMPPNPHALAILEPHYLLSDLLFVIWAAIGIKALMDRSKQWGYLLLVAVFLWPLSQRTFAKCYRREHFYNYDFARNVLRCAPPQSVIVLKKDVQLYSLWHYQSVQGWRKDVSIIAQGLSGASWYQADWHRKNPDIALSSLSQESGWLNLKYLNRKVLASQDAEVPPSIYSQVKIRGLLNHLPPPQIDEMEFPQDLIVRRGPYHYDETPDFFTSDLIDSYAIAFYRRGLEFQKKGMDERATSSLKEAWRMFWAFPDVPVMLSYMMSVKNDWPEAQKYGAIADALYRHKINLTEEYYSLPDLKSLVKRQAAESATQHGVTFEKMGQLDKARERYQYSLTLNPSAQTYYNLAVTYWNIDWPTVELNLRNALSLDPHHQEALRAMMMFQNRKRG